MRDHILKEIQRLSRLNDGKPPGVNIFTKETGIGQHQWLGKLWARWSDAVAEAGYQPNKIQSRLASEDILDKIIEACRYYGYVPTKPEFGLYRRHDPSLPTMSTITNHFGNRSKIFIALAKRAAIDTSYADIAAMLPKDLPKNSSAPEPKPSKTADGFVYLIKSGEFYKIGRSDDIERRVKEIRIALPDKADIVHTIRTDDPSGIEAYWHQRFRDRRANGEWFRLSSLDVSAFKKRKYQ